MTSLQRVHLVAPDDMSSYVNGIIVDTNIETDTDWRESEALVVTIQTERNYQTTLLLSDSERDTLAEQSEEDGRLEERGVWVL